MNINDERIRLSMTIKREAAKEVVMAIHNHIKSIKDSNKEMGENKDDLMDQIDVIQAAFSRAEVMNKAV